MAAERQATRTPSARRLPVRWFGPLAMLVLAAVVGIGVFVKLRREVWAFFTDEAGLRVAVQEGKARAVLWDDPRPLLFEAGAALGENDGTVAGPEGKAQAAFSADGKTMVFAGRGGGGADTDLFGSAWNGRVWSRPQPLVAVNTDADEQSPALSQDGRYLYFSSDRAGGQGGADLYVARWNGSEWTGVAALGESINTPANETGPAPAADDAVLYFSSNWSGSGTQDIFVAARVVEDGEEETNLPPVPRFSRPRAVDGLNSDADDLEAAWTTQGDHVFLASNRNPAPAGYGLYLSRVIDGRPRAPERIDLHRVNGEASDPAVRMDGFELHFTAGPEAADDGPRLYRTTTREVIGYTDQRRWEQYKAMLEGIGWWIVLALLALVALLYLLESWQDISSLFHKCLAGSAAVHLLILLATMLWLIAREIETGGAPQTEVAISIEALAQEALAMESEPEHARIAESEDVVMTEKFESDFMLPVFRPREVEPEAAPIVTKTSRTSLVPEVRPSRRNEARIDQSSEERRPELAVLTALSQTTLPEPERPALQEEFADVANRDEPADLEADLFKPVEAVAQVETVQAREIRIAEAAVQDVSNAEEIEAVSAAETKDTGGETVVPHRGLEAEGAPPELDGSGELVTALLNLPGAEAASDPLLPGELETPQHELDTEAIAKLIHKTRGRPSLETIVQLGGSDATERAIRDGLDWLVRSQEGDGRWSVRRHGGNGDYDTAGTGLALLCFYGWGARHDRDGPYRGNVQRALEWLLGQQKENGDLRGGGRMYCHGIAAIALCEAYGVTQDPKLKEPAERAIALIAASQSPSKGGWRYEPADQNGPKHDADLSVTGWQYMAMHSARLAGLEVPEATFEAARRYLQEVSGGRHGGLYGYVPGQVNPAMVATGMFCRQLDLVPPDEPRMAESAEYLKTKAMNVGNPDFYYVYYATLALYQHQGPVWAAWNESLKETLPTIQRNNGNERGSWDHGGGHGNQGGRVVSTTFAILSLEVYYRLLPMYGFRGNESLPEAKRKGG